MKRSFLPKFLFLALGLTLATLLAFPISCTAEVKPTGKIGVAVSILPVAEFVESVGGEKVEVTIMVPPGAEPHTYEVKPSQMAKLAQAKMYAKVGAGLEFELAWMDKLTAINKRMLVVDASQGIRLHKLAEAEKKGEAEATTGTDPHIWLSVQNAQIMVENIYQGLIQVDPANKAYYEKNRDAYWLKLAELDKEIRNALAKVKNRRFLIFHSAFAYFARDYNLEEIAIEQGGKEPTTDYLLWLIKEAKEQKIKVIFVTPQFSTKSAELIAKEIGGRLVTVDDLAKDYINNMRAIASAMREAMQ